MQCGCAVWVCGVGVRCGCAVWVCGVGVRCGCAVWSELALVPADVQWDARACEAVRRCEQF
jgi:hypothetical protein